MGFGRSSNQTMKLLEANRKISSFMKVSFMMGESTVETTWILSGNGVFDCLPKSIGMGDLIKIVANAIKAQMLDDEHRQLLRENKKEPVDNRTRRRKNDS